LAPIVWFLGVTVSESGDSPAEGATADEILTFFQEETGSILLGAVLFMLGTLLFIAFITVLRDRWRGAAASDGAVALAYVTGVVGAAFLAATWAPQVGVAIALEDMGSPISAATAEMAWHGGAGFFVIGELLLALFLFATAALIMGGGALPKWLGWVSILLGVVALIPPIGWAAIIFGLPLWLLVTSVLLLVSGKRPSATT
jgi:hypothetical protein